MNICCGVSCSCVQGDCRSQRQKPSCWDLGRLHLGWGIIFTTLSFRAEPFPAPLSLSQLAPPVAALMFITQRDMRGPSLARYRHPEC